MKIGFIGLGIMGKPMAKNLLQAGFSLKVYNRSKDSVKELVSLGAIEGKSIADTAKDVDVVITMLPDSPDVKEVMLGKDGVFENTQGHFLYIDMSSIAPLASQEIGKKLLEKDIHMLDAPVSGGDVGAIAGTLSIMVGGEEEDFNKAIPLFKAMGKSHTLIGKLGSGNTCKLTNNLIVAASMAALAEGLMLAKKTGTDMTKVIEAIRGGSAGSNVVDTKSKKMIEETYIPGFKIDLHIKDLRNALKTGEEVNSYMPLTKLTLEMLESLSRDFHMGNDDHTALYKYYLSKSED
ncbi:MAG: 2-hydroxy-3-oxopropionate reductase [Clostridiaceae bacterium]